MKIEPLYFSHCTAIYDVVLVQAGQSKMQLKFKFGSIFDAIQQAGIINLADGLDNSRLAYISHLREQAAGRLSTGDLI